MDKKKVEQFINDLKTALIEEQVQEETPQSYGAKVLRGVATTSLEDAPQTYSVEQEVMTISENNEDNEVNTPSETNEDTTPAFTFVDRNVQYPNRFTITKIKEDGSTESFLADLERYPGTVITEGTKLNAANLNLAMSLKQDKLTAGTGINITGNVISAIEGLTGIGYEKIAQPLFAQFNSQVDLATWTAVPLDTTIGYGVSCYYDVDAPTIKYQDATVDFEISNVLYDTTIDADPAIVVRFNSATDKILCQYSFIKNRAVLRRNSDWVEYGRTSNVYTNLTNGSCKMRVCRTKRANGTWDYQIYLDNVLVHSQNITDNLEYANVQIGFIGCKATLKYWKLDGTF